MCLFCNVYTWSSNKLSSPYWGGRMGRTPRPPIRKTALLLSQYVMSFLRLSCADFHVIFTVYNTDVTATSVGLGCFRTLSVWFSGPPCFVRVFLKNFPPNEGLRPHRKKNPHWTKPPSFLSFFRVSWNSKWWVRKYTVANASQFFSQKCSVMFA